MATFRVWTEYLNTHDSDADYRKSEDKTEGMRHYFDIDNYAEFAPTGHLVSTDY